MIHASESYNRIQDPENKIGQDEPVFLLRGQDNFAPHVMAYWADLMEENGKNPRKANEIRAFIKK